MKLALIPSPVLMLAQAAAPSQSSISAPTESVAEVSSIQALGFWGWVISVAMVALFLLGCRWYLWPLWSTSRTFERATERVRANRGARAVFPARPRHLNDLWSQYLNDREGTTVQVGPEEISTVDPEDTFTEHAVLEGYNRNMALAFAGVFTGLGILGTFLGLVVGLGKIGTEQDEMMVRIVELLGGMSTAFYTSIFGITLSLIWLFADRALYHQVQRQVQRFFLGVRKGYPVESADRLLHRLLAVEQEESVAIHATNSILVGHGAVHEASRTALLQGNALLEEQKAVLQTLGTDLAVAFQDAISNSMGNQVAPLLQGVIDSVQNLSTQMGDRQVHLMGELVHTFQERLSAQMSGQFEQLAGALQQAAEWQERVHGDLEKLLDQVRDATAGQSEVIKRSSAACDLYQQSLGELDRSHRLIAASSGQLEALADRLTIRLEEASGGITRNLERTAAMVNGMAEALTQAVERVDLQSRALEGRISQLDAQQETYRAANEEIRTYLAEQIDQLGAQVGSLREFWSQFRDDLSGVGDGLRSSVAEFSVFTADKLREIFARFDAEMAKVVEHLSGTLSELREVTEDLPSSVEHLRDVLAKAVEPLTETSRTLNELPTAMKSLEELVTTLRTLEPLGDHIRNAAQQVTGTDRSIVRLSEQLESTGNQFSVALSLLGKQDGGNGGGAPTVIPAPRVVAE